MFGGTTENRLSTLEGSVASINKDLTEIKNILRVLVKEKQSTGGIIVPANVDKAIVAATNAVEQRIYDNLNKHLIPTMKKEVQWLNYQTEDTQEQITNYQMDQMMGGGSGRQGGGGGLQLMSTGSRAQLHMGNW